MDCIDHHVWSNKLARVNLRKGMERDDGDASMNIEWRHLLPQWSGQARAVITPVSLQITPHLPNSDKFNSNPSLKCSPAQTGGEKSASAALPQIVKLNHTRADFIIRQ